MHKLHGGGISRAIRCICVISVAIGEPAANLKCQFGGTLPQIRLPFRREICNLCINCSNNSINCNILMSENLSKN